MGMMQIGRRGAAARRRPSGGSTPPPPPPPTTPTLVATLEAQSLTMAPNATTIVTSASFTPAAGELLIVKATAGSSHTPPTTITGGGLTWTKQATVGTPGASAPAAIWTAPVTTSAAMTVTVSYTSTVTTQVEHGAFVIERYTGATLAGTPVTITVDGDTTVPYSADLATTATNSVVSWIVTDYVGVNGAVTYVGSPTETYRYQEAAPGVLSFSTGYQAAAAAGAQTFGLTAPTGQKATLAAVELLAATTSTTGGALVEDPSTPAVARRDVATSGTVTSPSFTPPVGALMVALVTVGWVAVPTGTPTLTLTDSNGGTWTAGPTYFANAIQLAVFTRTVTTAVPRTVTATSSSATGKSMQLAVRVVTGAAASQFGAASVTTTTSMTTPITTTTAGSLVYVIGGAGTNNALTATAATTNIDAWVDAGSGDDLAIGRATGLTATPGPVSVGWAPAGRSIALEILPVTTTTPGGGGTGSSALLSTLVDTFDAGALSGLWATNGGTVTANQLSVPVSSTADAPIYANVRSAQGYQWSGSSLTFQVPAMPAVAGVDTANAQFWIMDPAPAAIVDRIGFEYVAAANRLDCIGQTGAAYAPIGVTTQLAYSATVHQWMRLVHTGTQIVWSTSPDGATWTVQRTLDAPPTWTSKTNLLVSFEGFRTTGTNDTVRIDNVNNAAGLSLSSLSSDFTTMPAFLNDNFGGPTIVSGAAALPVIRTYSAVRTAVTYRGAGASTYAQITPRYTVGANTFETGMQWWVGSTSYISMYISGTAFLGRVNKAGVITDVALGTYNATIHAWWRLREAAGTIFFDTSADGTAWTNRGSQVHGLTLTPVALEISSGFYGTETQPLATLVDNLNVTPTVTTPPTPASVVPAKFVGGYLANWSTLLPRSIPSTYTLIFLAFATINADGTAVFTPSQNVANLKADIAARTAAGKTTILSAGGGGGAQNGLGTTAAQDAFFTSITAIIDAYGFQGIDWDLEVGIAGGISVTGMASLSRRLVARYGSSFAITMAPYGSTATVYKQLATSIQDILTFVGYQFYNDNQVPTTSFVLGVMNDWMASCGLREDQFSLGFMHVDDYLTLTTPYSTMASIYQSVNAAHPGVRGAWDWEISSQDQPSGYQFASTMASVVLTGATVPGQVTGLTVGTVTASTVALSWTATSTATSYLVEYRAGTSGAFTTASSTTGTTATVTGLAASTGYQLRVTASNTAGAGTPSATVSATTTAAPVVAALELGVQGWRDQTAAQQTGSGNLGASFQRVEFTIGELALATQVADFCNAAGIRLQPLIGWDNGTPAPDLTSLATWASTLGPGGSHWAGGSPVAAITDIELGNENSMFYKSGLPGDAGYQNLATAYGNRARDAAVAINNVNPSVGVLVELEGGDSNNSTWVNRVLTAGGTTLKNLMHGPVIHLYGPNWQTKLDLNRGFLAANGVTKPYYVTETGISTDNGRALSDNYGWPTNLTYAQAATNHQSVIEGMASQPTKVKQVSVFNDHDNASPGASNDREAYFGITTAPFGNKGAVTTYFRTAFAKYRGGSTPSGPSVPGQVTGLAVGTVTTATVALSWSATSTATSYLVEYRVGTSGAFSTLGSTSTTSTTVTGLTSSTGYQFRVTASNTAGAGTPSTTVSATTAAVSTPPPATGTFTTPIATTAPPATVFPTQTNPLVPARSATLGTVWSGQPAPTNAWYEDWIVDGAQGVSSFNGPSSQKLNVFPYMLRRKATGLDVCIPKNLPAYTDVAIINDMRRDMSLYAVETTTAPVFTAADTYGVTLKWAVDATRSMSAPIVRGMAYTTMTYAAVTPRLYTGNAIAAFPGDADNHSRTITSVNGQTFGTVTGTRFVIVTQGVARSGYPTLTSYPYEVTDTQTWVLYASSSLSLTIGSEALANNVTAGRLTATAAYTGTLRLARLQTADGGAESAVYDAHAARVPTGGALDVAYGTNSATATVTWATTGSGPLLTFALPHHQDTLVSPSYPGVSWSTLRGTMRAVAGLTWQLTETLPTILWQAPQSIPSGKLSAITNQLAVDQDYPSPAGVGAGDIYNAGKTLGAIARLVLIADAVGDTTRRTSLLTKLRTNLTPWFDGVSARFYYDSTWGGVPFLASRTDGGASFGNGYYNDHHFHHGYLLYAAAVVARYDTTWAATYKAAVNVLIRDVANPSSSDSYFPLWRYTDWYEGHTWPTGLASVEDGRGAESTSEAVNFWYAMVLWGTAIGDTAMVANGRYALATEVRTAQRYWHMPAGSDVYPSGPMKAKKTIGIVHQNKVTTDTYFGSNPEYHTNIQAIPHTPASELLLDAPWAGEAWTSRLAPGIASSDPNWVGYSRALQAVTDPDAAFAAVQALTGSTGTDPTQWDWIGTTKTNLLWWAATRPGAASGPATVTASASASLTGAGSLTATATGGTSAPAAAFNDPIATSAPAFTTAGGAHPIAPQGYYTWSVTGKQYPTNAWWQNLLIPYVDGGTYNGKTATYPYAQWPAANDKGLTTSYHGAEGRSVAASAITLSAVTEVGLEVNNAVTAREIIDYTDLGVSLRWTTAAGTMTCHLVEGMGFNSAVYAGATPVFRTQHPILAINGAAPSGSYTGTKFKIQTSYNNRVWVLYASSSITLNYSSQVLTASGGFTGTLQFAYLPASGAEADYDTASTAVLTGGAVAATYTGNTASLTFTWSSTGTGAPLVMALPHHQDAMPAATYTAISLLSLKGTQRGIRASSWTMTEPLTTITWNPPATPSASAVADISAALEVEKNSTYDWVGQGYGVSPYYGGKYVAKLARLAAIAQQIGSTATASTLLARLRTEISNYLAATPTGTEGVNGSGYVNALQYKGGSTWRGIATQNGWADMGADFGSGRFNDHHFHYGYWIYAAAVAGKDDATWRASIAPYITALIRDIANPSHTDSYFPRWRYKDWFHGHSWASGLVGLDVGPDQESVSEACNAWHGIQLWGEATGNTTLRDLGRVMLATEVRAAKKYWHIYDATVYPAPFSNDAVAVSVRTHKVARETFFGNRNEYFYGIEAMPFTPAAELYDDAPWVTRGYAAAAANIPVAPTGNPQDTGWNAVIYGLLAVIDPADAYAKIKALPLTQIAAYSTFVQYGPDFDNGQSKAAMLQWAATRP